MIAQVVLPLPIPKTFTYRVPSYLEPFVIPHTRVKVPFAKRSLTGLVIGVEDDKEGGSFKPTDISEVIDLEPLVDSACFSLCSWAARHYCTALGLALKSSFPLSLDIEKYLTVTTKGTDLLGVNGLRLKRSYAVAGKEKVWQYYHMGLIEVCDVFTGEGLKSEPGPSQGNRFSATLFRSEVEARREHYLSLVLPLIESGLNALMLLPDHGIAGDYFHRFFHEKLGEKVLLYGSQVSAKGRSEVYLRLRKQGGYLVIGTRSCLFLPVNRTGLIIVERPEDDGYRNDQVLQFNAVTLAAKLAELQQIPICYGSVSPPLDLMKRVEEGSIQSVGREPLKRPLEIIKVKRLRMSEKPPPELTDLLIDGLACDERIVIHTPLKDYAARLRCLSCRRSILCPVCDSAVSLRKQDNHLICWKCGRQFPYDERCRHCGSELIGFGSMGAGYVEEHIKALIPDASVMKVTGDVVKNEGSSRLLGLLNKPRTIIVGTQILSKFYGIETDRLILLGWEDFLRIAGYRAREYMYQTYCNLIDALCPAKVHLLAADGVRGPAEILGMNSEDFYREELKQRRLAEFPPYLRLFLIKVVGPNSASAASSAKRVRNLIEEHGFGEHLVGETCQPGERGRITILLKGEESLPDGLIDGMYRLRHVRVEADPQWV